MTKKHYEAAAKKFAAIHHNFLNETGIPAEHVYHVLEAREEMLHVCMDAFVQLAKAENPRFDEKTFNEYFVGAVLDFDLGN